jgi:gamma-glutamylcysteine synthetase
MLQSLAAKMKKGEEEESDEEEEDGKYLNVFREKILIYRTFKFFISYIFTRSPTFHECCANQNR